MPGCITRITHRVLLVEQIFAKGSRKMYVPVIRGKHSFEYIYRATTYSLCIYPCSKDKTRDWMKTSMHLQSGIHCEPKGFSSNSTIAKARFRAKLDSSDDASKPALLRDIPENVYINLLEKNDLTKLRRLCGTFLILIFSYNYIIVN